jgi:hypothetical protein
MGILVTPELMTTSVVEVGTTPVLQLVAVAHAVVPPSHVVCALDTSAVNCISSSRTEIHLNCQNLLMLFTMIYIAYLSRFPIEG